MYTNTNPELRRIVPDAKGRTKVKVVYVVLEAQYQSALTKAVQNLNAKRENVCITAQNHTINARLSKTPDIAGQSHGQSNVCLGL